MVLLWPSCRVHRKCLAVPVIEFLRIGTNTKNTVAVLCVASTSLLLGWGIYPGTAPLLVKFCRPERPVRSAICAGFQTMGGNSKKNKNNSKNKNKKKQQQKQKKNNKKTMRRKQIRMQIGSIPRKSLPSRTGTARPCNEGFLGISGPPSLTRSLHRKCRV